MGLLVWASFCCCVRRVLSIGVEGLEDHEMMPNSGKLSGKDTSSLVYRVFPVHAFSTPTASEGPINNNVLYSMGVAKVDSSDYIFSDIKQKGYANARCKDLKPKAPYYFYSPMAAPPGSLIEAKQYGLMNPWLTKEIVRIIKEANAKRREIWEILIKSPYLKTYDTIYLGWAWYLFFLGEKAGTEDEPWWLCLFQCLSPIATLIMLLVILPVAAIYDCFFSGTVSGAVSEAEKKWFITKYLD